VQQAHGLGNMRFDEYVFNKRISILHLINGQAEVQ